MYSSAALVCPSHSERKQNAAQQQGYGGEAENVLVVHGDEDKVVPHSHGVKLAKVFGVSLESCKGGGHSGIFETHPKQYVHGRSSQVLSSKACERGVFCCFLFLVTIFTTSGGTLFI